MGQPLGPAAVVLRPMFSRSLEAAVCLQGGCDRPLLAHLFLRLLRDAALNAVDLPGFLGRIRSPLARSKPWKCGGHRVPLWVRRLDPTCLCFRVRTLR